MKIYISVAYSNENMRHHVYSELRAALVEAGHEVTTDNINDNTGESFYNGVVREIQNADLMTAIITDEYVNSKWCNMELNIALQNKLPVLAVAVGETDFVPSSLYEMQYIQVKNNSEITEAVLKVLSDVGDAKPENEQQVIRGIDLNTYKKTEADSRKDQLHALKKALEENHLTVVCGAGVSIDSGIPTWGSLLVGMLNHLFANGEREVTADELLKKMAQSSNLITGKYLKLLLGDSFEKSVKQQLYANLKPDYWKTDILKAISLLARPQRDGIRLESVISFNFDDLIERRLSHDCTAHRSIWMEGQSNAPKELPIYHVHGFLPNTDGDPDSPNLVFSEESYHSQFIDPYSWSNLCQLNAFSTNVCLFVGLSLSDPNLRRLLDISHRRNNKKRHYIILKTAEGSTRTDEIVNMLFEQDANSLGLNVIWVKKYEEIPGIIRDVAE